jgi:uncharacterized protein (TIGR03083 family)
VKLSPRYDGAVFLTIDGRADDQLLPVTRQRRRLEALLNDRSDDEWRSASRCEGWTVQDVVAHLAGVNVFWVASVLAGLAGAPTKLLAAFDPARHPALLVEGTRSLSPREVLDQFVTSNDGFLGALATLDEAGWSALAETPVGHVSIRLLAHHALWDSWVHERDIAIPLGLAPAEEPDEVESCLQYAAAIGPALRTLDSEALAGEFGVLASDPNVQFTLEVGNSVAVRHQTPRAHTPRLHGAAVELVEALSVREPLPADTPDEWRGLVNILAAVFDNSREDSSRRSS